MPIGAGLLAFGKSWTEFGPFNLDDSCKQLAAVTAVGVVVLVFAGIQPPNDIVVNHAIGVFALMALSWFVIERRRFEGPPIGDVLIQRQAALAIEDQAVAETA